MIDNLVALKARDDLLKVWRSWPLLQALLVPGKNGEPGGAEAPLPIDPHVSTLMADIEERAKFYARVLLDEVPATHGCDDEAGHATRDCPERVDPVRTSVMPGLLREVANHYGHFTTDEDEMIALGFCDDVTDMVRRVDGLLTDRKQATYVGPCPACEAELYLRDDRDRGWCRGCGVEYTRESQTEFIGRAFEDRLMTASEIVSALLVLGMPVPYSTVRRWTSTGRLLSAGDGLYRLSDARDLAARRRRGA